MRNNKKIIIKLVFIFVVQTVAFCNCSSMINDTSNLIIENSKLRLIFNHETGALISFYNKEHAFELVENSINNLPWSMSYSKANSDIIDKLQPRNFSFQQNEFNDNVLIWDDFEYSQKMKVQITINLDVERSESFWNIEVLGLEETHNDFKIASLQFPIINGIKDLKNEKLVLPNWMGSLVDNPRKSFEYRKKLSWNYPGTLSSQLLALYSDSTNNGIFISNNDSLSYTKDFAVELDELNDMTNIYIDNYVHDSFYVDRLTFNFQGIIGTFNGDWITMAEIYKKLIANQKWIRESRFKNGLTPKWLENTAVWVWNRGKSDNVLKEAIALKRELGLPVSVFWHWWHNSSYDDDFPKYLPPREGEDQFIKAVEDAQKEGVNCHVYMNSRQWGDATDEWISGEILPYTVKDKNGNINSHNYNIFSGKSLISMCVGTEFWKEHYSTLCDSVVNYYSTNGVYMDQTCQSLICYDKSHGHSIGGGNFWVKHSGEMISMIRNKSGTDKKPIFTGEGSGESWLPHLDAFLTLQVSRERYAGVDDVETIPFFQAVFHEYGISFGNYSSLVTPPYDELWPQEFAPDNTESLLDSIYNLQFLMEQARSLVWGMQPTIANYHSFLEDDRKNEMEYFHELIRLRYSALKYLLRGEFRRTPTHDVPFRTIDISKLSIYAGRKGETVTTFKKSVPLLYSGSWQAKDNDLGIVFASISNEEIPIKLNFEANTYNLPREGYIYINKEGSKQLLSSYTNNEIVVDAIIDPFGLVFIEVTPSE